MLKKSFFEIHDSLVVITLQGLLYKLKASMYNKFDKQVLGSLSDSLNDKI